MPQNNNIEDYQEVPDELRERFEDFLDCRGLTKEQAAQAQLRPLSGREAQKLTGVPFDLGGVYVPFLDEHGEPVADPLDPGHLLFQIRRFEADEPDDDQELGKYIGRSGGGWDIYVPPTFDFHSKWLVITEGPLKALIATFKGIPTAAIPSVSSFADPVKRQQEKAEAGPEGIETPLTPETPLLPKLIELCQNRTVAVAFDADGRTNPKVASAAVILAEAIKLQASAKVATGFIPSEVGSKGGIDDWLQYASSEVVKEWINDLFCNPALIYFADALEVRNDPSKKIYITFSPQEANALAERQYGDFAQWKDNLASGKHTVEGENSSIDPKAICLNVFMGRYRYLNDHAPLDLSGIDWAQREVALCPGSDVWQRGDEKKALYALGRQLAEAGAIVDVIKFTPEGKHIVQMTDFLDEQCHLTGTLPSLTLKEQNRKPKPAMEHPTFTAEAAWWLEWSRQKITDDLGGSSEHPHLGKIELPQGFRMSDDHQRIEYSRIEDGALEWHLLCSVFKIDAMSRDEQSDDWGRRIKLIDPDNQIHTWPMSGGLLSGEGSMIRQRFLEQGGHIEQDKAARDKFQKLINDWKPAKRVQAVSKLGWVTPELYALPEGSIGDSQIEITVNTRLIHKYAKSGSLQEWQENVARLCRGNSRLIFGLCAAFASFLLFHTGDESGGIHYRGASSKGKSEMDPEI